MATATPHPQTDSRTESIARFLNETQKHHIAETVQSDSHSIRIPYPELYQARPDIADDLLTHPDVIVPDVQDALERVDLPVQADLSAYIIRFTDLPETRTHPVGDWDPDSVAHSLIGIKGQVSKRTKPQLVFETAVFQCLRCGVTTSVPQPSEGFQEPHECDGCERQGPFERQDRDGTAVSHQSIRLQVAPEDSHGTGTDTIDVRLQEDLVGTLEAGDRIICNAIIRTEPKSNGSKVFELVAEGHSIERLESSIDDVDVDPHKSRIETLADRDDALELLADSISPGHFGDASIKRAIALQLFGGVSERISGELKRGTIHILLVGDPGCGKSGLLHFATNLAPRSKFATGKGSSAAGLTAAAVQDDFGGGSWTLEAGALVEAHGGLAAIDELDKMDPADQSGMLDCMSDQMVSISKAGISTDLPAETTILAAANPEDGRFNGHAKPIDQIPIEPVLLSRFDLVFTLRDEPEESRDRQLASHQVEQARAAQHAARGDPIENDAVTPAVEADVVRAWIALASQLSPVLTDAAAEKIPEEYVDIRSQSDEAIATTPRDNDAVIRLAEACARVHLSETIEPEHVDLAISLRRTHLETIGFDPETGEFDADIVETGMARSQHDRINQLKSIIVDQSEKDDSGPGVPLDRVMEVAESFGIVPGNAKADLQKLKNRGEIYEPNTPDRRVKYVE